MSQGIRTEIKHLYKRLRSLAAVRRRDDASQVPCAAGEAVLETVSKPASRNNVHEKTSGCPLRGASSALNLIGRIFASMPASSGSSQLPHAGCILLRFNEIIRDKGARLKTKSVNALYAGRRIEKFCKAGLDGPRPILNLARDDLDHQYHSLNCCR